MPERESRTTRRRKPAEEEVEAIEARLQAVRSMVIRCMTGLIGREAVEHLLNAKKEVLLAARAFLDARIQRMEEATQRLRRIEVEGEEA
ncbi:MAG TPA: hypothetical protein EYP10_06550 [Armatimonadetes bacterium]|nr:hypothetical protein [Armatimonadota bacterium]